MPDADSVTLSGSLSPSITPSPPARLTVYHQRLLASTATVPVVTTSHPPRPDWIIVMNITGTSATPNVGIRGGGGSHTIYLRYKEVGDTNWNSSIFQADTGAAQSTVPIVMTGLTPNTNYKIQVSFDNSDWSPSEEKTFTTKSASATLPKVSSIRVSKITACQASVDINFPNPSGDSVLVYYSWKTNAPESTWGRIRNYPSRGTGASVTPGFSSDTTYVIGATFDSNFANNIVESAPFTTQSPPYLDRIRVDPIGDTTATVRVEQATFCSAPSDAHFRYKPQGTEAWVTRSPGNQYVELTGLTPLTEYVVEASIDSSFETGVVSTTFTTKVGEPSVDRIEIPDKDITQIGAKVIVHVDSPNGDDVDVRYSTDAAFQTSSTILTDSAIVNSPNTSAEFTIDNLTSGTTYYVEASYDDAYPTDKTETANFTTHPPVVSIVEATTTGQTSAQLTITIAYPNGQEYTVYSQYRTTPQGDWVDITERPTTRTDTAVVNVTRLTSDTEYEARASLNSSFPVEETVMSGTFGTWPPGVNNIELKKVTQTTATITVTLSAPNDDSTLYMVYGPEDGTWAGTQQTLTSGQTSVDFELENLVSGTTYDVRISYDARLLDLVEDPVRPEAVPKNRGSTSNKALKNQNQGSSGEEEKEEEEVEFTGLSFTTNPPSIDRVEASIVEQTTATITVTIDEPNNDPVYLHYKKTADSTWNTIDTNNDPGKVVFNPTEKTYTFNLTGLTSGTLYTAYASYDSTTPQDPLNTNQKATFTTNPPSIDRVEASNVKQTNATVTATVTAPNTTSVQLHYKTATGSWQSPKAADVVPTPNTNTGTATINLDDLTSGTEYTVYASYDPTTPQDPLNTNQKATFTTNPPSIDRVEALADDTTQTEAKMRVYIEAPNGTDQTVYLRYQSTAAPEDDWGDPQSDITDDGTVDFPLQNLSMATTYLVQASFADDFSSGTKETTFTTDSPDPQVGGITFKDIEQSTATAEITIANPGTGQQTAYLHYRVEGDTGWTPDPPLSGPVTDGTAEIELTGLTSGTRYEVQASLDSTVSTGIQSATFITDPPTVTGIEVVAGQTRSTATVTVSEPNGKTALYLRYGLKDTDADGWSNSFKRNVNTEKVDFTLSGLEPDTEYTVHASYDIDFPSDASAEKNFRTPPLTAPNVKVTDTSQTNATVTVSVTGSTGDRIVYLRYQPTQAGQQAVTKKVVMSDGSATATLSDLRSHTQYRVDASFSGGFPAGATGSDTFTTEPPSVYKVEVGNITETTAEVTVTIAAPNGNEQTVSLETTPSGPWIPTDPVTTDTATVAIDLTGLTPGTQYEVEATLAGDTNQVTRSATFTTASDDPGVSGVTITDESQTGATATITIANVSTETEVSVRYQVTSSGNWSDPPLEATSTTDTPGTATIGLTGLTSGTQYQVQASLDSNFATGVQTATFRTLSPLVSGVSVTGVTRSEATVTVEVTAPNGDPVFLQYRTGSNEWISHYANVGTEDSSVEFTLRGLSSSTTYTVQASYDSTFGTGVESDTFTTSASQSTPRPRPRPPGGGGNGGGENQAPEFMEGTRTVRSVVENTPPGEEVGKPIPADDPDDDHLTYSLVGPDAGDFDVAGNSGQLLTRSPLDYETKAYFAVTVSVRDGMDSEGEEDTRRDDSILVAILVTDEDESGAVTQPPTFAENARTVRSAPENTPPGVNVGDPIAASDPDDDTLAYSLNGLDAGHFDIVGNSGQLLTRAPLDYETKSSYKVTVSVHDGKGATGNADSSRDDSILVTILVNDQEEPGIVTLSAPTPRVGTLLTTVLVDPDGGVTNLGWVWERSADRTTWTTISNATSATYTPTADDDRYYLRVTASYTDRRGGAKAASAEPDTAVTTGIDQEFTDVDDTNSHKQAIDALAPQGIFVDTECGDLLFCPDGPIKRWVMAVWIIRLLGEEPPTVGASRFTDIEDGQWWIRYVERLADRRITVGCDTDPPRYCPDQHVTRSQIASFLVRTLNLEPSPAAGFTDTEGSVHAANIDALFAAGITIGCDTDPLRYCPSDPLTRAQMATFLYRMAPWLDRAALIALYNSTGGPDWHNNTNWLTGMPIGEWHGVGTNPHGRVTSLDLARNGLNGAIPPEVANLTNLQSVQLANNTLTGCVTDKWRNIPESDLDELGLPYCE